MKPRAAAPSAKPNESGAAEDGYTSSPSSPDTHTSDSDSSFASEPSSGWDSHTDSDESGSAEELVDVDFDFFDLKETDAPFVRQMVSEFFSVLGPKTDEISAMSDALLAEEYSATTIRTTSSQEEHDKDTKDEPPLALFGMISQTPGFVTRSFPSALVSADCPLLVKCSSVLNYPAALTASLLKVFAEENAEKAPDRYCLVVKTMQALPGTKKTKKPRACECIYPDDDILTELAERHHDLLGRDDGEGRRLLVFARPLADLCSSFERLLGGD